MAQHICEMKSNQPAHVAASVVLSQNENSVLNRCRGEIVTLIETIMSALADVDTMYCPS